MCSKPESLEYYYSKVIFGISTAGYGDKMILNHKFRNGDHYSTYN